MHIYGYRVETLIYIFDMTISVYNFERFEYVLNDIDIM